MICPRCGTDNRESARFCDECGYALSTSSSTGRLRSVPSPLDEPSSVDSHAITLTLSDEAPSQTLAFDEEVTTPCPPSSTSEMPAPSDTLYIGHIDPDLADIPPSAEVEAEASLLADPSQTQEMPKIDQAADIQSKAYRAPTSGRKPKIPKRVPTRKKVLIVLLIILGVLVAAGAAAYATYALQLWGGKEVPNVIGLKVEDATARLEDAGFTVSQVLVKSDDVEGIVLKSIPEPERRAEVGSEVTLDISCARTVPEVVGLAQDEALALLQTEGFENVEVSQQKSNGLEGTVIAVSPEAGVRSKAQATISLIVAIPFVVPSIADMSLEEATMALKDEGYGVTTAQVYTEEVPEGIILGTDPEAGSQLSSGSEVCINIAKSRSAEILAYARAWFGATSDYTMNGMSYELERIDALNYQGDDACTFTVVMRPYETHSWFGSEPETRYGNEQRINGTMRFSSDGQLESIDPALAKK